MVLRPIAGGPSQPQDALLPVWAAVEPTQQQPSAEYWLITQPDHAALAGSIAAALGPPLAPRLEPEVIQGIAVHDDGWAALDAQAPCANGRPLSFLEHPPATFVPAWAASIDRAQRVAPIAGAIVSQHFSRLGQERANARLDSAEDRQRLLDFLAREKARQQRLSSGRSAGEVAFLTDILQFCDLLSLYLCCGAQQNVEFPQKLAGRPLRLRRIPSRKGAAQRAAVCQFEPSPLAAGVDLAVMARRFPASELGAITLPFLLW